MPRIRPAIRAEPHLADMDGTWLALTCCNGVTHVPVRLLAGAAHPTARLRNVLARMRCRDCRDWLAAVSLAENPAATGHGGPPAGWVIQVY